MRSISLGLLNKLLVYRKYAVCYLMEHIFAMSNEYFVFSASVRLIHNCGCFLRLPDIEQQYTHRVINKSTSIRHINVLRRE